MNKDKIKIGFIGAGYMGYGELFISELIKK